jgi:pimeloyl-ACP methyl ester carboxylesterase
MAPGMAKLLVSLLVGAALALAWIGVRNRHRFRYVPGPLSVAELGQMARDGFVAEEFEVEPGVLLRGLVRVPAAGTRAWLVMFAGNGGGVLASSRALGASLAPDSGWGVAVWAYRGFDGSGGTPDAAAFAEDSEKLWQRLQTKFGADPAHVHLVSFSLGTALALRIAALSSARGAPPASLVLLSPYDRIQVTQDTWWAPWSLADRYDALAHARGSPSPVLVVWGALDDAVPPGTARALGAALGPRARLLELPGAGHAGWLDDEAVLRQVREFLREHTSP